MKKSFKNLISEETLKEISNFIGKEFFEAYLDPSSNFDLGSQSLDTREIAIKFFGQRAYFNIRSDWVGDTEEHALDCHKIEVSVLTELTVAKSSKVDHKGSQIKRIENPTMAAFFAEAKVLSRIEIYEIEFTEGDENVHYDCGIVLYAVNADPIVIRTTDSIAGGVTLSISPHALQLLKDDCRLRTSLPK